MINQRQITPQALKQRKEVFRRGILMNAINGTIIFTVFFVFLGIFSNLNLYYQYKNVPENVFLSRTFYNFPESVDPKIEFPNDPTYFQKYQFYPLYLSFFNLLAGGNSWFSLPLASLFQCILVSVSFYFMLVKTQIVNSPLRSSFVLSLYPISFILHRNLCIPSSLSFSFINFSFAFYFDESYILCGIFCILSSITSFEGFIAPITFVLCLIFSKKYNEATIILILSFLSFLIIFIHNLYFFHNGFALLDYLKSIFSPRPFLFFPDIAKDHPISFILNTVIAFLTLSILGTVRLLSVSIPHFIFCMFSFLMVMFFNTVDIENYGHSWSAFAVIIGFDNVFRLLLPSMPSIKILLVIEICILFFASFSLQIKSSSSLLTQYCMNIKYPFEE